MSFSCLLLGHNMNLEWDVEYSPALGKAKVEKAECQRCGYRVPTGRDRPIR